MGIVEDSDYKAIADSTGLTGGCYKAIKYWDKGFAYMTADMPRKKALK